MDPMEISFDDEINSFLEINKGTHKDSSCMDEENLYDYYQNDFSFLKNKSNYQNNFFGKVNENPFCYYHKEENGLIGDDIQNLDPIYFQNLVKNNRYSLSTNKETNLEDLNAHKSELKTKQLFEIRKEPIPRFFNEDSINNIIKNYNIS